jgi:hypothetical protein
MSSEAEETKQTLTYYYDYWWLLGAEYGKFSSRPWFFIVGFFHRWASCAQMFRPKHFETC